MELFRFFRNESQQEKSPPLPLGSVAELPKEKLPAVEVKNRVLWVNPNFPELPLDLPTNKELEEAGDKGEEISSKLGVFLTPLKQGDRSLEVLPEHGRSGGLGRVIFRDRQGKYYRDLDAKGIGYSDYQRGLETVGGIQVEGVKTKGGPESYGLLNLADAYKDMETSEEFLAKGIRAHRVIAIISLREIVDKEGNRVSIEDAKKRGILSENSKPVVEIRAYGTKHRIQSASPETINDARTLVAQELGKDPKKFNNKEYFFWMAETIAKQVALMHKNGFFHGYLTRHNITLDGRITDFDSVVWLHELKQRGIDINERMDFDKRSAQGSISSLADKFGLDTFQISQQADSRFRDVYQKTLNE